MIPRRCTNCGAKNVVADAVTGCGLCGGVLESPEDASAIQVLGVCITCGIRPRSGPEGECDVCDPPHPLYLQPVDDAQPFLPEDE